MAEKIPACPRCGKRLSAYVTLQSCPHCGWRELPLSPPFPALSFQSRIRTSPPPFRPLWMKTESTLNRVGSSLWNGYRSTSVFLDRKGISRILYRKNFYVFVLWGVMTALPLLDGWAITQGVSWLVFFPMILSWVTLAVTAQNRPFPPLKRLDPRAKKLLLFALPFCQKSNTNPSKARPYWVSITVWVAFIMIIFSFYLQNFLITLTGIIIGVLSFCTLLF